ncbi:Formate hydrogenlyase subunit 3 [Granulibacter bethesdensis]|uniref:Formate hydrogenlyase subunit 3 n=1 Tax=Granulibacter bethesdensis TaxID=364410 RepID=A0AAC9P9S6_9PROT|nr:hypothetical protein [Granulibacter bethesdensis]APH55715.1 Formate hydrogenlyase subunit 3 [Granulibacter bethesdensis]APH63300.1 Formate hydrogenlyase subunit 3 [Granulibacter bethesdensis]
MAILPILLCAFACLGLAGERLMAAPPRQDRRILPARLKRLMLCHIVLCAVGGMACLSVLLGGASWNGTAWVGGALPALVSDAVALRLGLDGFSAFTALAGFCALGLASATGLDRPGGGATRLAFVTAALMLTVMAADVMTLAGGIALLFVALWACPTHDGPTHDGPTHDGASPGTETNTFSPAHTPPHSGNAAAIVGIPLLIISTVMLMQHVSPAGRGPVQGVESARPLVWIALLLLTIVVLTTMAALRAPSSELSRIVTEEHTSGPEPAAPDLATLTPALPVQRSPAPALATPAQIVRPALQVIVPVYLLGRLGLDFLRKAGGPGESTPLMLAGAILALAGGISTLRGRSIGRCVNGMADSQTGLAILGCGLAVAAMAVDLPDLASLALASVLIIVLSAALLMPVLGTGTTLIEEGAGTTMLDRLGGIIIGMPRIALLTGAACLAGAMLPPSPLYAGRWMLVQALIGGQRIQDAGLDALLTLGLVATALASGLGIAAVLRLICIAILGRPRAPRAAASTEPRRPAGLRAMQAGLAACIVSGLIPGPVLHLLHGALAVLCGHTMDDRTGWIGISAQVDSMLSYTPLWIALALICGTALLRHFLHGRRSTTRNAAPWNDGDAPAPPWLPFGDPATQPDPDSVADTFLAPLPPLKPTHPALSGLQSLLRMILTARLPGRAERFIPAGASVGLLAVLCLLLAMAALEARP